MTVTFQTSGEILTPRGGVDARCSCVCHLGNHYDCVCWEDCPVELISDAPAVNLSNANAADLLVRLGFEVDLEDLGGRATANDFMERVLNALATEPIDTGIAPTEWVGPAGVLPINALHIDCGRRPGYVQDALHRLWAVADAAQRLDRPVIWV
jgi:hypothetical protein